MLHRQRSFLTISIDDQLTVMPPKSTFGDYDICGANRLDRCSVCIDRVVNRLELVSTMSDYLLSFGSPKDLRFATLFDEIFYRFEALRCGIIIRSALVENDFVSIMCSHRLCQLISDKR